MFALTYVEYGRCRFDKGSCLSDDLTGDNDVGLGYRLAIDQGRQEVRKGTELCPYYLSWVNVQSLSSKNVIKMYSMLQKLSASAANIYV